MDKQGAPDKTETQEEHLWNMENGTGHLGGIKACCQSMQGCDKERQVHLK